MYTLYRVNADELDSRFLNAVKAMFENREIEIAVCGATESEEDETSYLLKSPANRDRLFRAIENVTHNRNLVTVNLDEFS